MNNRDLYKATFSQVHAGLRTETEDYKTMKPVHKIGKRAVILAAAVCLVLACSAAVFAANLFGLKDLVLNDGAAAAQESGYGETDVSVAPAEPSAPAQMISLQGFSDSSEYKAAAEWQAFLASYDQDGSLLAKVGNGPTGLDDRYALYLVYTQEMAGKLDEIVSKYGLKLHSTLDVDLDAQDLYDRLGTGAFLGAGNTCYGAYLYEDGTFHIDGSAAASGGGAIDYQMMNCMKGSFTDTLLNIGDADSYDEWTYTTPGGAAVSLSLGPDKALVFADLDRSFMTVNVLAGTAEGLTAEGLEAFADAFDFSMLK